MSSPSADADPAAPTPIAAPSQPRRASHLRAVRSPDEEARAAAADASEAAGEPGPASEPTPAARRSDNAAYVVVLLVVASGVAATAIEPSHWLRGVLVIGAGVAIGALARAFLPARRAGLLAVRGRTIDVICLSALAVLIVTVGFLIPH